MLMLLKTSLRAIYAGAAAFGTGLSGILVGEASLGDLTDGQWVTISVGALVAAGGVWGFVNVKPAKREETSPAGRSG